MWKSWPDIGVPSEYSREKLTKTTENSSYDSRSPSRDLNPESPDYKGEVLTTRPRRVLCVATRVHIWLILWNPLTSCMWVGPLNQLRLLFDWFSNVINIGIKFISLYTFRMSRVSSGSIVSDYGLDDWAIGVRFPAGEKDFSYSLFVQTGSGAHPPSCTMGTGSFPRG
jgi:hypothetical protein